MIIIPPQKGTKKKKNVKNKNNKKRKSGTGRTITRIKRNGYNSNATNHCLPSHLILGAIKLSPTGSVICSVAVDNP